MGCKSGTSEGKSGMGCKSSNIYIKGKIFDHAGFTGNNKFYYYYDYYYTDDTDDTDSARGGNGGRSGGSGKTADIINGKTDTSITEATINGKIDTYSKCGDNAVDVDVDIDVDVDAECYIENGKTDRVNGKGDIRSGKTDGGDPDADLFGFTRDPRMSQTTSSVLRLRGRAVER